MLEFEQLLIRILLSTRYDFNLHKSLNSYKIVETWNLKVSKLNIYLKLFPNVSHFSSKRRRERFKSFPYFFGGNGELSSNLIYTEAAFSLWEGKVLEKINLASSCTRSWRDGTTNYSCTYKRKTIFRFYFWKLLKLKLHKPIICFCKLGEVIWTETQIKLESFVWSNVIGYIGNWHV